MVWTYLGPPETQRPLPEFEYNILPPSHVHVSKRFQECHFSQGMDGDLDFSHLPFLHRSILFGQTENAPGGGDEGNNLLETLSARYEIGQTPYGLAICSVKPNDEHTNGWWIGHWALPWFTFIPAFRGDGPLAGHAWVPIDDQHTYAYAFVWHPTRPIDMDNPADHVLINSPFSFYSDCEPGSYQPIHTKRNDYVESDWPLARNRIDRMRSFQDQDLAITESMGGVFDRTKEHLGAADTQLIQQRAFLAAAARDLRKGIEPPGLDPASYRFRGLGLNLPSSVSSWKEAAEAAGRHIVADPESFIASV